MGDGIEEEFHLSALPRIEGIEALLDRINIEEREKETSSGKVKVFYPKNKTIGKALSKQELTDYVNEAKKEEEVASAALEAFERFIESSTDSMGGHASVCVGAEGEIQGVVEPTEEIKAVKQVTKTIEHSEFDAEKVENRLYEALSLESSFKEAYKKIPENHKSELNKKLRTDNNILWRALQFLADSLGIKTNIGYSGRHLNLAIQKQTIENAKFIIRNNLYGRVNKDIVKTILTLPENERDGILFELFNSSINRPEELGGQDLLNLENMLDALLSSPEGVTAADKLWGSTCFHEVVFPQWIFLRIDQAKRGQEIKVNEQESKLEKKRLTEFIKTSQNKLKKLTGPTDQKKVLLADLSMAIIKLYKDNEPEMLEKLESLLRNNMKDKQSLCYLIDFLWTNREINSISKRELDRILLKFASESENDVLAKRIENSFRRP